MGEIVTGEFIINLVILALVAGGMLFFGARLTNSPRFLKDKLKDVEKERNSWRGKYYTLQRTPNIKIDKSQEVNENNAGSFVQSIADQIAPSLPKWARGLAKNKELLGMAEKYIGQNPEGIADKVADWVQKSRNQQGIDNTPESEVL